MGWEINFIYISYTPYTLQCRYYFAVFSITQRTKQRLLFVTCQDIESCVIAFWSFQVNGGQPTSYHQHISMYILQSPQGPQFIGSKSRSCQTTLHAEVMWTLAEAHLAVPRSRLSDAGTRVCVYLTGPWQVHSCCWTARTW